LCAFELLEVNGEDVRPEPIEDRKRLAAHDVLQRWPVSKRVNSSRAPDDDPTLVEPIPA
jgi:ATP-dependent DNA ligase